VETFTDQWCIIFALERIRNRLPTPQSLKIDGWYFWEQVVVRRVLQPAVNLELLEIIASSREPIHPDA
jgi:hypothetical protein